MNEQKLNEIAEQAMAKALAKSGTWAKEFAELIVFECVNAVMDGTKEGDHYAQLIETHFNNSNAGILHFGIEE